ncbi:ABC transporter permease [Actinomyces vulturis]|uniref:ABC transporter permease n=1 Tax=Actinomyces vulturis TaxID=1857645 RepID=UPI0009F6FEF9|nr:ABC transporter permease [Actinomyces vulturis]
MFSAIPFALLIRTLLGCSVLLAATAVMQKYIGLNLGWQAAIAGLRAVVQLAVLSLVLRGAVSSPWLAGGFLILMMTIASITSARRNAHLTYGPYSASVSIFMAASTTIAFVFILRMLDFSVPQFIAIGGIITGNCMSAATLGGRRFAAASKAMRGEVEGWFALGATPPVAFREVSRISMREMLIPKLDQTKNTGLVTMPGAFVGALFGGASPIEAARFQVVVLVAILFAQTLTGWIQMQILSRATVIAPDV